MTPKQALAALRSGSEFLDELGPVVAALGGPGAAIGVTVAQALLDLAEKVGPAINEGGKGDALLGVLDDLRVQNDALAAQVAAS